VKEIYYPKFNVDGLLRGTIETRMKAYSTGITNGFISPNEARQKENMPPIPDEEGGNYYFVNGSYVRLKDIGAAYKSSRS
ncbi:MAG: phage portal protein, partial [Synergistaceae bacterium]|nr:phage portal protein [Synergistaceae bacterium]